MRWAIRPWATRVTPASSGLLRRCSSPPAARTCPWATAERTERVSSRRISHFYSQKKNTIETTKLVEMIRHQYRGFRRIYLSWDAAPWDRSKALHDRIEELNAPGLRGDFPEIRVLPLPGGAQFLNVIESVFSGMARAIIHNSDYASVEDAKAAISRYFEERNRSFQMTPRKAGRSIWGRSRHRARFSIRATAKTPNTDKRGVLLRG